MKSEMKSNAISHLPTICAELKNLTLSGTLMSYAERSDLLSFNVTYDPCEFCNYMALRQNDEDAKILFGPVQFGKSLFRDCYVGIFEDPNEAAAIIINKNNGFILYLYIPEERKLSH